MTTRAALTTYGWLLVLLAVEAALVANLLFIPVSLQLEAGMSVLLVLLVTGLVYRRFRPKLVDPRRQSARSFWPWTAVIVACLVTANIVVRLLGGRGHADAWFLIEMWPAFIIGALFERWWAERRHSSAPEPSA